MAVRGKDHHVCGNCEEGFVTYEELNSHDCSKTGERSEVMVAEIDRLKREVERLEETATKYWKLCDDYHALESGKWNLEARVTELEKVISQWEEATKHTIVEDYFNLKARIAELERYKGMYHDSEVERGYNETKYRMALEEIREHYRVPNTQEFSCKCGLHKCPYCIATEALKEKGGEE